jgi:hypothetical protein
MLSLNQENLPMSHDRDNRANQLNPNNSTYWSSRGHSGDPRNGDIGDDEDDSSHPYNLNPRTPGIGFSGLPKHRTPVGCLPQEAQQRAEEFRLRFLDLAQTVIKPAMDKYVSRLTALNVKSEARNTVLCEYFKQEWPFVEFQFGHEPNSRFVPDHHVRFFCTYSEFSVEVSVGTYTGIGNARTYIIDIDAITPARVSQILNSAVRATFKHLYYHRYSKNEKGATVWTVEEITDLVNFTPMSE